MSTGSQNRIRHGALNLPNQITIARLALAVIVFVLLPLGQYLASLVLFVVAAATDWIDGYLARRNKQVTQLGRILDPFADKILICGAYIFLAAEPASRIPAWMAVVVVARELLVTALRSFLEERGADFSATQAGKLKMALQCLAVVASLCLLGGLRTATVPPAWLPGSVTVLVWLALVATVYSGIGYVISAARLLGAAR